MTPFFSIIIPTYNSEKTLAKTLDTILNQTFSDFEVLIVDGDSKDKTLSIASEFNNPKIKVFSEPDKGLYDAMNKGIALSKGEWLYFIGSDDYLYSDNVLLQIANKIKRTTRDVVYGNVLIKGDTGWAKDGQIYNGKFSFQKLLKSNICHQSMFYRKSFVERNDLFYELKYPVCADWDFNIRCRQLTDFAFTDTLVAVFNAGGISTGDQTFEPFLEERKEKYSHLYEKYKPSLSQRVVRKVNAVLKSILN